MFYVSVAADGSGLRGDATHFRHYRRGLWYVELPQDVSNCGAVVTPIGPIAGGIAVGYAEPIGPPDTQIGVVFDDPKSGEAVDTNFSLIVAC
jgi:hypothetical protein